MKYGIAGVDLRYSLLSYLLFNCISNHFESCFLVKAYYTCEIQLMVPQSRMNVKPCRNTNWVGRKRNQSFWWKYNSFIWKIEKWKKRFPITGYGGLNLFYCDQPTPPCADWLIDCFLSKSTFDFLMFHGPLKQSVLVRLADWLHPASLRRAERRFVCGLARTRHLVALGDF